MVSWIWMTICQTERVDKLQHSLIHRLKESVFPFILFPWKLSFLYSTATKLWASTNTEQSKYFLLCYKWHSQVSKHGTWFDYAYELPEEARFVEFPRHPGIHVRCICRFCQKKVPLNTRNIKLPLTTIQWVWLSHLFTQGRRLLSFTSIPLSMSWIHNKNKS